MIVCKWEVGCSLHIISHWPIAYIKLLFATLYEINHWLANVSNFSAELLVIISSLSDSYHYTNPTILIQQVF